MSQPSDLMGLGMPPMQANALAVTPLSVVSAASPGTVIKGQGRELCLNITATSGGNNIYITSPQSADGSQIGDTIYLVNRSSDGGSSVVIQAGSSISILCAGASTVGTTGVSVSIGNAAVLFWATASCLAINRGAQ